MARHSPRLSLKIHFRQIQDGRQRV